MHKRTDLRKLAREKLKDAIALYDAKRHDGAFYLCGYAIELALKSRICTVLKWTEFPETPGEFEKYGLKGLKTHDFAVLLRFSGRETKIKTRFLTEWSTVAQWQPELRYRTAGSCTPAAAQLMINSTKLLLKSL